MSRQLKYRALTLLSGGLIAAVLAGCAAEQAHQRGMQLVADGKRQEALVELQKAVRLEPNNAQYRIDYRNQVLQDLAAAVERAQLAQGAGDIAGARAGYSDALKIDPTNEAVRRALAMLDLEQRMRAIVAEAEKLADAGHVEAARDMLRSALADNPASTAIARALVQMQARLDKADEARQAKLAASSVMKRPVTLQFRDANLRMVFEALSRTTGLNVIMDRDVRADLKTTIFVRDASVDDTVNLILLQNQLEKKVLNANTLFIYPATANKQKEYQDLKVRTFQLSNADGKHVQNVLKSVLKVKDMALDERTNTLVIRDTPAAIAVAEKIVLATDLADAEVMMEVQLLEITRDRLTNLGVQWPNKAIISTPPDRLTLSDLKDLSAGDLRITPLAVGINLQLEDSDTNLLASPRIRARDREKARILIGDKVPVITNTVTPVASGSSVVTGQVQYLDVGIKLEVEPRVYLEGDIGIKLNLEVSNIVKQIGDGSANSTLAYQIGTRSASTTLRLRDGETQVLGGLISDLDRTTAAKVPGLWHLPVLGRIFRNDSGTNTKSEIVLSITPRIVRGPGVAEGRYRDVFSGTDAAVRDTPLRLDPVGAAGGVIPGSTMPTTAPPSAAPRPVAPAAAARSSGTRPAA
ncbi:MAG TPA: secretin N-terminal domain-containing protein, partial [Burkholderiaceae bacterium]|nr:secretin N-terminal domain-containing protein [Burkholderiaceae bacterium]